MIRTVIRRLPLLAGCLGTLALSAGCGASNTSTVTYARYQVTCCESGDINQLVQPGEVFVLHWMVVPASPTSSSVPTTLPLTVTLQGPYSSVTGLKSGAPATYTLRAPTVTTNDRSTTAPTSSVQLPAGLPSGYYNLEFGIAAPESIASGASVIQVGG
jgi:hypothetical protein